MKNIICDFHLHSNYSDGELNLIEVYELAKKSGLKVFSVTDHNCISPEYNRIKSLAKKSGISLVEGIEISCFDRKSNISMHILGYSKEFDRTKLSEGLKATRRGYEIRGHKIIDNLNYENPDFNLDYKRMQEFYQASYIGRNQIALELTKQSKKISLDDALKAAFIKENNEWMLTPAEAIKLINDSGGKAFLAHPKNLMSKLPNILSSLKTAGLSGVEAITAKISLAESTNIIKMAKKYNLSISAGSDWHGSTLTPNAKVGFDIEKNDLSWLTKPQ